MSVMYTLTVRHSFQPEFHLAAACATWPPDAARASRIEVLVAKKIDWPHFLNVTQRHRVIGLARHGLHPWRDSIPREIMDQLNAGAARQLRQSLLHAAEASRVVKSLSQQGIPVAVLKGVPLSILAYGDLALRHSRDNDLLISPDHLSAAAATIEGAGYTRIKPSPEWRDKALLGWQRYLKHFEYAHRTSGARLELHWRISANPRLWGLGLCQANVQDVAVLSNCTLPTFATDELLLYLCLHGATHAWFRLKWLADVAALLREGGPNAALRLLELADAHNMRRPVAATLELSREIFQMTVSPVPMDAATRLLIRIAMGAITAGGTRIGPCTTRFGTTPVSFSRYLLHDDWRFRRDEFKVGFMAHDATPSALPSWAHALPRILLWFRSHLMNQGRQKP